MDSKIEHQLREILTEQMDLLIARPEMLLGNRICLEGYFLAFDAVSRKLCGRSFYRDFLFSRGFGATTIMSKFQQQNSCKVTLSAVDENSRRLEESYWRSMEIEVEQFKLWLNSSSAD